MVREIVSRRIKLIGVSIAALTIAVACGTSDSGTEGGTHGVIIPGPTDPNKIVCDPFSSENTTLLGHGLASNLYYLTADQPRYGSAADYSTYGHRIDATIYLNDLNVPTRAFDRGFISASGTVLQTVNGDTLYEYFGLHIEGGITLGANDSEGDYQLSLLADDGATWQVDDGAGYRTVVNDDGVHPTQMICATTPVHLAAGQTLPMKVDYYQGPRYHIALVAMWRPWNAATANDPLCGQSGNSLFFDSNQVPSAPMQAYTDLLARGWRVLNSSNYMLPAAAGGVNPCSQSAPVISNFRVDLITQTSATVYWDTDVPTSSQVFYTIPPSSTYTASALDTTAVTSHFVNISGLTNNTLYSVYGVSKNAAGIQGTSPSTNFRTLR